MLVGLALGAGVLLLLSALLLKLACKLAAPVTPSLSGACGVILMQMLPFFDTEAVAVYDEYERAVYSTL